MYDGMLERLFGELSRLGPSYRDHTTVLITADHGRGSWRMNWTYHALNWSARDVFLAAIGPHTSHVGRADETSASIRLADIRPTVELLLGLTPAPCDHSTCGAPIQEIVAGRNAGTPTSEALDE